MIEFSPVIGGKDKQAAWEKFRAFHYEPDRFLKSAECYLVRIDGSIVGFIASRRYRGRFGDDPREMWTAHKTAVRLPVTHPDYFNLWAQVSDAQAKMHVARGHRFVCMAPLDHAVYRDQPNSGWAPSTKDRKRQATGYRSHAYIGKKAHQRVIRENLLDREPLSNDVLTSARVVPLSNGEAASIILKYEWLGTMATGTKFCYALKADKEVLGVSCFSLGGSEGARDICTIPAKSICLARGACVPHAPTNAGSFLVRHACRQAHRDFGYEVFFAYSDPEAGEIGTIYQAVGWEYITATKANRRKSFISPDGTIKISSYNFNRKAGTERKFYDIGWDGVEGKYTFLRRLGFIEKIEPRRGKYVWFEGARERRRELRKHCRFPFLPYPKRQRVAGAADA